MKTEKSLLRTLHNQVKRCHDCGTERVRASLDCVPASLLKQAKAIEKQSDIEIDYYLYCPRCKEYSVLFCGYGAWI